MNHLAGTLWLIIVIQGLCWTPPVLGSENKLTSLSQYLAQVQAANPTLEAAKQRAAALESRITPGATLDDPFVAVGLDEVPFGGGGGSMIRYQISQSIPFPGKLSARSSIAEKRAEAAKADAETTLRQLRVLATQLYFRVLYNHRQIAWNDRIKGIVSESIGSTKSRYRTGESSHHEWLLGKVELGTLEAESLRLRRERTVLHATFNELRNYPGDQAVELSDQELDSALKADVANGVSLDQQPELKAARFSEVASESEKRLGTLSYFPDFVLQGMVMKPRMMSGDDEMGAGNWGVMVGVNLPIFFWRKQSELVAAAEHDRLAAAADRQALENRLNSELTDAREQLKTASDVVTLYKRDVIPATVLAAKSAESGYRSRKLPLNQYLETLRVQRTQELELLAAQIDVVFAKTRLREVLSSPPVLRLAPSRPTLFGSDGMGSSGGGMSMGGASGTVNMGSGMSGPTRKQQGSSTGSGGSGMSGMGGME